MPAARPVSAASATVDYFQGDIMALGTLGPRSFDVIDSGAACCITCCRSVRGLAHPLVVVASGMRDEGCPLQRTRPQAHRSRADRHCGARLRGDASRDIRRYRQELGDAKLRWLSPLADFYSLSECRDLLFHVIEHNFTLPKIASGVP